MMGDLPYKAATALKHDDHLDVLPKNIRIGQLFRRNVGYYFCLRDRWLAMIALTLWIVSWYIVGLGWFLAL